LLELDLFLLLFLGRLLDIFVDELRFELLLELFGQSFVLLGLHQTCFGALDDLRVVELVFGCFPALLDLCKCLLPLSIFHLALVGSYLQFSLFFLNRIIPALFCLFFLCFFLALLLSLILPTLGHLLFCFVESTLFLLRLDGFRYNHSLVLSANQGVVETRACVVKGRKVARDAHIRSLEELADALIDHWLSHV